MNDRYEPDSKVLETYQGLYKSRNIAEEKQTVRVSACASKTSHYHSLYQPTLRSMAQNFLKIQKVPGLFLPSEDFDDFSQMYRQNHHIAQYYFC